MSAAVAATALLASCGRATGPEGTGAGSLPFDGRSPLVPPAKRMRVLVELRRPSLAEQVAKQDYSPNRQRLYVGSLGNEAKALQGALEAKGVKLRRPVLFARVWNGFAATVDTSDLPQLRALGLRAEPVRRFYGAAGGGGQDAGNGPSGPGKPSVAVLDSKRHGAQMKAVLAQAGADRVLPIRVAGVEKDARTGGRIEVGTTDRLLAGLERAVDPDGDGDTSDHVPVALVGVNSPYAGFADSPESVAGGAARSLGTLVVAPAGNEGPGERTVGSPAAAPGVLAVGAIDGGGAPALPAVRLGLATSEGRALLRGTLLSDGRRALRAPVATLAGPSQANPREKGRALGGSPLEYFSVNATPRAKGRLVVVPARSGAAEGPALAARVAAAAEAGAAGLVVCETDSRRTLTAIPDGGHGIPVIGLRGSAAERALALTAHDGGLAFMSAPEQRTAPGPRTPAPSSSRGPTYALAPKPDIAAPGTVRLGGQTVAGTSVAAARVAAAAVALHEARPAARPDDLAAALIGTARPLGPALRAGAGELQPQVALAAKVLIEPASLSLPRQEPGAKFVLSRPLTVRNPGSASVTVTLAARLAGVTAKVTPGTLTLEPGAEQRISLEIDGGPRAAGYSSGRVIATGAGNPVSAVVGLPIGPPPPARLGDLTLTGTDGVRFTAGAVSEHGGVRSVEPLGNLRLQLVNAAGKVARELTPPGGARDLLPGEYAYTLTKSARQGLAKGSYSFAARGLGPAGGPELVRKSPSFTVR